MRCNVCWRELEGQAVSTTCGHLLCTEDAGKILGSDGACPVCDQVLSKSHMKAFDTNPNDECTSMAMIGVSPQILMRSAHKSVMFYIGQRELEMQYKMNRIQAQYRQKFEAMQEKFGEKMEQLHAAYQKMAKRCQIMEQEIESLSKDKLELQEKFSEKSRQKRKLDEMYDQLRSEYESVKRSAIQPSTNFFSRNKPDIFSNQANIMMDNSEAVRKDWPVLTPETPGPKEDIWPARQNGSNSGGPFDITLESPAKQAAIPVDAGNRRAGGHTMFGNGASNPSMTKKHDSLPNKEASVLPPSPDVLVLGSRLSARCSLKVMLAMCTATVIFFSFSLQEKEKILANLIKNQSCEAASVDMVNGMVVTPRKLIRL